jgi:flagellar hook-associated protein 3 FlgL
MFRVSTKTMADNAVNSMLGQQSRISKTQMQLSSGLRITTPSDDPIGSVRVVDLKGAIGRVELYQANSERASSRLEEEEGVLTGVTNLLQRVHTLAVQGNNTAVLSAQETGAIADEVRLLVDELEGLANSRDASGDYMFAGYKSGTKPFARTAADTYTYSGDQGQRQLQIGADRTIADGDNGFDLFMNVATGPYAEVTGIAATGFGAIAAGDLTINGISVGAIPAAADAAERASQIRDAINAISDITGVNAALDTSTTVTLSSSAGDIDVVAASTANTGLTTGTSAATTGTRNIFETMLQLASTLDSHESVDRYLNDIKEAMGSVSDVHSTVGARMNAIDEQSNVNADIKLALESHLSDVQDLDYTEAISRLNQQTLALQAAQQAYVKVQGLSLFNYI